VLAAGCAQPRVALPPVPAARVLLTVVTWNMHAGQGDLPRLLADLDAGRLTGMPGRDYLLLLQEAIEGSPADVVTIGHRTQLSVFYSPVRQTEAGPSGNAILSTLPLIDPHAVQLPQERQPRAAIVTAIDLAGQRFPVVAVHLENREGWLHGGIFSDQPRRRQAEALLREIPSAGPAIAGGDFNSLLGPTEAALRLFGERFRTVPENRGGRPTFRDRLALDHLFFDLPRGWQALTWVVPERYGSDHNPVVGLITADRAAARR
jgi:endonuclease/exonuclease/phosphatase family metal-dependent hydrolase